MGSVSSHKLGGMILDLEKDHYTPGEQLKGNLYLNAIENIDAVGLELNLQIIEAVKFDNRKDLLNTTDIAPEEKIILTKENITAETKNTKIILYENTWVLKRFSDNVLVSGHYTYPFTFTLPEHLPGSFEYYDDNNSAFIKYILSAKLLVPNGIDMDIHTNTLIIVRQSADNFDYPPSKVVSKKLKTWCCKSQGKSALKVAFSKEHFHPDERLQVQCDLDNSQCKLNGNLIKLEFYQTINLADTNKNRKSLKRLIGEQTFKGKLVNFIFIKLGCWTR